MKKNLTLLCLLCCISACAPHYPLASRTLSNAQISQNLQPGDVVHVTVFEEPDLSGTFPVNSKGEINLPLIAPLSISNMNEHAAAKAITERLKQGYVRDPKVSVALAKSRFIFVLGEVQKPGSYDFMPNMTVLQAVAQAGGYTYRADNGDIVLTRYQVKKYSAEEITPLLPGDTIMVGERYF